VDRLGRQRRLGGRARHRQRRDRLQLGDLPRAPAGSGRELEDLPGRRRRARRGALLGLGARPVHRQLRRYSLLYFRRYQNAAPGTPLADNARTGTDVKNGGTYFDILAADVKNGTLPSVSWIVAPEAVTEHPAWPAGYGAWYTAGVLDALTSNPDVWSKTALLICFDENDGFFDHVVSPYPNVGGLPGQSTVPLDNEFFAGKSGTPGGSDGVPGP
jgi:phospholipase C